MGRQAKKSKGII